MILFNISIDLNNWLIFNFVMVTDFGRSYFFTSSMDEARTRCSGLGSGIGLVSVLEWSLHSNGGWNHYHAYCLLWLLRSYAAQYLSLDYSKFSVSTF